MSSKWVILASGLAGSLLVSACDIGRSRIAYGDVNRIIVVAPDELWDVVGDSVHRALEPHIFTVRDERTFDVTHISPADPNYATLRQFRLVLVIGAPEHSWVAPVLDGPPATLPAIVDRENVWARNQTVTALALAPDRLVQGTYEYLPALYDHFDRRYRQFVQQRMFASQPNAQLQERLAGTAGFSLLLPQIYRHETRDDAHVFRTVAEMGAQVIRTITVVARPGVDPLAPEQVLAWRDSLAATLYDPPHATLRERFETRSFPDPASTEVQGSWSAVDNGWPYGGPFVSRAIPCPAQDRTYLADAWVFAPGRPKYEYLIQFEILLDTFVCAP
jgi:hypothetical protein